MGREQASNHVEREGITSSQERSRGPGPAILYSSTGSCRIPDHGRRWNRSAIRGATNPREHGIQKVQASLRILRSELCHTLPTGSHCLMHTINHTVWLAVASTCSMPQEVDLELIMNWSNHANVPAVCSLSICTAATSHESCIQTAVVSDRWSTGRSPCRTVVAL